MLPDFLLPPELTLSDVLLMLCVIPAAWFVLSYGFGSPWWRVQKHGWLGVVTFLHSLSVALLLTLVVYGIVFGQAVSEPWRVAISALLLFALTSKVAILHYERREGRIERLRHLDPSKEKAKS
jgi:hypothetical protein